MSATRGRIVLYLVGLLAVLVAAGGAVQLGRSRAAGVQREADKRRAEVRAGTRTLVTPARRTAGGRKIQLQGEARPFASVTLYAKVSGYLKEVRADRGDQVRGGQILAVIHSPELDRQYEAARADANVKRANARRAESLAGPGAVSVREADLEKAGADMAEAAVASLGSQRDYATLRAPFAGTVTARFADAGALLQSATGAQTGALPVVTVSQLDRLRVFVYVDQREASFVRVGDQAEVEVPFGGGVRKAQVWRAGGELDPRTRTMPVELLLDNADRRIVAGSFVTVRLAVKTAPLIEVPAEALLIREQKPLVAVVPADGRVQLRPVRVAEHQGSLVLLEGDSLREGELVALNVGRSIADGDVVQAVASPAAGPAHAPAAK